jgi:hypothetical protein
MGGEIFIIGCVLFVAHPALGIIILVVYAVLVFSKREKPTQTRSARSIYERIK